MQLALVAQRFPVTLLCMKADRKRGKAAYRIIQRQPVQHHTRLLVIVKLLLSLLCIIVYDVFCRVYYIAAGAKHHKSSRCGRRPNCAHLDAEFTAVRALAAEHEQFDIGAYADD
jgi:hypothetical protein